MNKSILKIFKIIKSREGYLFKYHHGNLLNKAVRQSQQTLVKINIMTLIDTPVSNSVRNSIGSYYFNYFNTPNYNILMELTK